MPCRTMPLLPCILPKDLHWLRHGADVAREQWPVWWPVCPCAIHHAPNLLLQRRMQLDFVHPPHLHVPHHLAAYYGEAGWIGDS